MASPRISIITVNYYSQSLIHELENKLRGDLEFELIVVDNSGEFESVSINTKVIRAGKNLGFGKASNLGAENASEELLLFLNPDAIISSESIRTLARYRPNIGRAIWGPAILDKNSQVPTLVRPGRIGLRYKRTYLDQTSESGGRCKVLYVSGACLMTTASLFVELGGFCDDIFLYAEDLELCERATRLNVDVFVVPSLQVHHAGGRSSARVHARWMRLIRSWHGHYRFLSKTGGGIGAALNALHLASGIRL